MVNDGSPVKCRRADPLIQGTEIKRKYSSNTVHAALQGTPAVTRTIKNFRKTLDAVAMNNEAAAIAVMRAADRIGDESLKQQLFNVIQRMNQDAAELQVVREHV